MQVWMVVDSHFNDTPIQGSPKGEDECRWVAGNLNMTQKHARYRVVRRA